jgi:hypothetical protein
MHREVLEIKPINSALFTERFFFRTINPKFMSRNDLIASRNYFEGRSNYKFTIKYKVFDVCELGMLMGAGYPWVTRPVPFKSREREEIRFPFPVDTKRELAVIPANSCSL